VVCPQTRVSCVSGFLVQDVYQFELSGHSRIWVTACLAASHGSN
jgi:hypothetical protein